VQAQVAAGHGLGGVVEVGPGAHHGGVDAAGLIAALHDKKIGGAAIDVFWTEPPPADHPFMTLENVTITPHLAGSTRDAFNRTPYLLLEEIKSTIADGTPRWVVNADAVSADFSGLK